MPAPVSGGLLISLLPLLGKDYDAAVLVSGLCSFGLGAFVDLINTGVVTVFLNLIK